MMHTLLVKYFDFFNSISLYILFNYGEFIEWQKPNQSSLTSKYHLEYPKWTKQCGVVR